MELYHGDGPMKRKKSSDLKKAYYHSQISIFSSIVVFQLKNAQVKLQINYSFEFLFKLSEIFPHLSADTLCNYVKHVGELDSSSAPSYSYLRKCFSEKPVATKIHSLRSNNKPVANTADQAPVNIHTEVICRSKIKGVAGSSDQHRDGVFTRFKNKSVVKTKENLKKTIAQIDYNLGEIVWCKIKGYSHWPAQVESFDKGKVLVRWFNDYRSTSVYKSQLFKFSENCITFSKNKSIPQQTAIKEALIKLKGRKI